MKIQQLIDDILSWTPQAVTPTVDTVKAGDSQRETRHVATCFMVTAQVLRQARDMGVDFIITHEPTYFNHTDADRPEHPLVQAKRKLVEESGITIWRYHDHMHRTFPDGIVQGVLEALGWNGRQEDYLWVLDQPRSARQMAGEIKKHLGAGAVRVTGALDTPFTWIVMAVGAPGMDAKMMDRLMEDGRAQAFFLGEVCEWGALEQIRDAADMGMPKAALTCGHVISERAGMKLLADKLAGRYPQLTFSYLATPEVYQYL
jgi:putative NIF3 family GTP cyclohydrolase 1 type 2